MASLTPQTGPAPSKSRTTTTSTPLATVTPKTTPTTTPTTPKAPIPAANPPPTKEPGKPGVSRPIEGDAEKHRIHRQQMEKSYNKHIRELQSALDETKKQLKLTKSNLFQAKNIPLPALTTSVFFEGESLERLREWEKSIATCIEEVEYKEEEAAYALARKESSL